MSDSKKLVLWGIVSVPLFGGILFASTAQSGSGSGMPLMIVTGLLAVSRRAQGRLQGLGAPIGYASMRLYVGGCGMGPTAG